MLVPIPRVDAAAGCVEPELPHGLAERQIRKSEMNPEFDDAARLQGIDEPEGERGVANPRRRQIVFWSPERRDR
jgi:hypothetical protein